MVFCNQLITKKQSAFQQTTRSLLIIFLGFLLTEIQIYVQVYAKFADFFTNAYIITHGKYTKQGQKRAHC
jgi:hypothetical protein